MKVSLNAHPSPSIAAWLKAEHSIDAAAGRDLGLRDTGDVEIFDAARSADACVMTKDQDFVELVHRLGAPLQLLWLTCGNTSTERLKKILASALPDALALLGHGEALVEISDPTRAPAAG